MHLDKAIEILSDSANRGITTFDQDFRDAEKLGIEALTAIKLWRTDWEGNRLHLLPSETIDVTQPPYAPPINHQS